MRPDLECRKDDLILEAVRSLAAQPVKDGILRDLDDGALDPGCAEKMLGGVSRWTHSGALPEAISAEALADAERELRRRSRRKERRLQAKTEVTKP